MLMRFLKGSGLEKVVVSVSPLSLLPLTKVITGWSPMSLLVLCCAACTQETCCCSGGLNEPNVAHELAKLLHVATFRRHFQQSPAQ